MLIEASVLARLLGLKLLTLEGSVLVSPAGLRDDAGTQADRPSFPPGTAIGPVIARRGPAQLRRPDRGAAIGAGLVVAAGILTESAEALKAIDATTP